MPSDWSSYMRQALSLALQGPRSSNPQVGCVIVDSSGNLLGSGFHHGAGTHHAEVEALRDAGAAARGATAIVTLEPCCHTGRTGPCTEALIHAGIARVVFAQSDPTDLAAGGAAVLRAAGVEVIGGVLERESAEINKAWTHVQRTGRPYVLLKIAQTLDGRVADASGGPTAITGTHAQEITHQLRSQCDAVMVGTSTALIDDPQLTVRLHDVVRQPLRVVMGERELPRTLRVFDDAASTLMINERDPRSALAVLLEMGVQKVFLEGGPTLAGAFLSAGLVDEVVWFIAPALFGAGPVAIPALGALIRVDVTTVERIGNDVMVRGQVIHANHEER
jgi:diaminohydroxyphosphoribosylaminopyrimidine deaminase/5-amino-6-(5-phosphoribosylamino)uracil reductase